MTPASNDKVFTIVSAMFALPKDLRFTTSINYNPKSVKNHVLYGNLYVKFTGDPDLNGAQLSKLIKKIRTEKDITQITGNVYLVGSFSGPYIPEGWTKEDSTFCYGAPASSFTLNRNCSVVKLSKIHNSYDTKVVKLSNTSNIKIDDTAKYSRSSKPTYISMDNNNTLHISGYLSRTADKMFKLAIKNPALKTKDTVGDFMSESGIKHNKVLIGKSIPSPATPQIITKSANIGSFMDRTLKHSDNLYAETILNTVGLKKKGIGSTKSGTEAVHQILY
jgi:D-alanyl-D-alanine carboxypeptidase/D-alanyl-D-alanine-endopeptidase (penicillin-binding protein 4)